MNPALDGGAPGRAVLRPVMSVFSIDPTLVIRGLTISALGGLLLTVGQPHLLYLQQCKMYSFTADGDRLILRFQEKLRS